MSYDEIQYSIALVMKYKSLTYSHSLAEAVVLQKKLSCRSSSRQPCLFVVPTNQTSFKLAVAI